MIGVKIHSLTPISRTERRCAGNVVYVCRCDCGAETETILPLLRSGKRVACHVCTMAIAAKKAAVKAAARAASRFFSRVTTSGHCWTWSGRINADGYGVFWVNGKTARAHRYSYELHKGPIGDSVVMHSCDNTRCVRPDHLSLGTQADNVADRVSKKRSAYGKRNWTSRHPETVRGSRNGHAKLTEDDVVAMRKARANGATYKTLMQLFGVCKSQVSNVCRIAQWRHVA